MSQSRSDARNKPEAPAFIVCERPGGDTLVFKFYPRQWCQMIHLMALFTAQGGDYDIAAQICKEVRDIAYEAGEME